MRPVIVVGDVMTDIVATAGGALVRGSDTPATISVRGGGSGANVACWLARRSVMVTFVGCVGDDTFGRRAVADLQGYGVQPHVVVDDRSATGSCVVVVEPDGERTMLPDAGANAALGPDDLPEHLFRPGAHLHLSGYLLLREGSREAARAALALAAAMRMSVSVDAASVAPLRALGRDDFLAWTAGAYLCLGNRAEALFLAGADDPRDAAVRLADHYGEVVVKLGAAGSLWHSGFMSARASAEHVDGPTDTTGAGDAFAAGFLSEWLLNPEPETALAAGNRLAAQAVAVVGGRPPLP